VITGKHGLDLILEINLFEIDSEDGA